MKEDLNEKRLTLIRVVLDLNDDQVSTAFIGNTNDPDATTQSHGGGHPPDPPPDPPPGGGQ